MSYAAIDGHLYACDETRNIGCEIEDHVGDLFRFAYPTCQRLRFLQPQFDGLLATDAEWPAMISMTPPGFSIMGVRT